MDHETVVGLLAGLRMEAANATVDDDEVVTGAVLVVSLRNSDGNESAIVATNEDIGVFTAAGLITAGMEIMNGSGWERTDSDD